MVTTKNEPQIITATTEPTTAIAKVGGEVRMARHELIRPIARPAEVVAAIQETQALLKETLVEGIDYGVIPGTGGDGKKARKVLLKPGAEKISIGFGCHPEYELIEHEVDHERVMRFKSAFVPAPKRVDRAEEEAMKKAGTGRFRKVDDSWQWQEKGEGSEEFVGLYRFRYRCRMVRFDGVVVGEGEGVCSSLESKYRSRPHDGENTILKMAQKRARIAATLDAFGLSDAFTQDLEDHGDDPMGAKSAMAEADRKPKVAAITSEQSEYIRELLKILDIKEGLKVYVEEANGGAEVETGADAERVAKVLEERCKAKRAAAAAAAANPTPSPAAPPASGETPPPAATSAPSTASPPAASSGPSKDEVLKAPSVDDPPPAMRKWIAQHADAIDLAKDSKVLLALVDNSKRAVKALVAPFTEALEAYQLRRFNALAGDANATMLSNEQLAALGALHSLRESFKPAKAPATTSATA